MTRLIVFNQITLDGYFTGVNGDISWAKESRDAEFDASWRTMRIAEEHCCSAA